MKSLPIREDTKYNKAKWPSALRFMETVGVSPHMHPSTPRHWEKESQGRRKKQQEMYVVWVPVHTDIERVCVCVCARMLVQVCVL